MKKLIILILLISGIGHAQTVSSLYNGSQLQVLNYLQLNSTLLLSPQKSLHRPNDINVYPVLNFNNQFQRTTIVIESSPYLTPFFQPILDRYNPFQNSVEYNTSKVEKPFIPTYIYLNLNRN